MVGVLPQLMHHVHTGTRGPAQLEQTVDEDAIAAIGGDPPRGRVRLMDVAGLFQLSQDVPNRR